MIKIIPKKFNVSGWVNKTGGNMKPTKTDLTTHSDNELSLLVFNDEGLYKERHKSYLKQILDAYYIYTDDQWDTLKQDLDDDWNEIMN